MLAFVMSCYTCECRSPSSLRIGKVSNGVTVTANNEWFYLLKCSAFPYLSDVAYMSTEIFT